MDLYKGGREGYNRENKRRPFGTREVMTVQVLTGKAIMEQIVAGKLRFYYRSTPEIPVWSKLDRQQEEQRFRQARHQAVLELAGLYDRAARQVSERTASIFAIHAMLLEDEDLENGVLTLIREQGVTAEYAVQSTGFSFADTFAAMDNTYMQARAADICDIARRVMRLLTNSRELLEPDEPSILVSDQFLPSEVMQFGRNLLGLIARKGSLDSHTAQLVQAYHIPGIVEVDLDECWDGHFALMDGHQGNVYLDPEQPLLEELRERYQQNGRPELCMV